MRLFYRELRAGNSIAAIGVAQRPASLAQTDTLKPAHILEAVNRGEFIVNGFRNRDLRGLLFGETPQATP
jgi:hypothetical protein